jgi:hypothetical protein
MLALDLTYRAPVASLELAGGVEAGLHAGRDDAGAVDEAIALITGSLLARASVGIALSRVMVYAGGKIGVAFVRAERTADGAVASSLRTRPAFAGMLGVSASLGPGALVVEGGYLHVRIDEADVSAQVAGLQASGGYALRF